MCLLRPSPGRAAPRPWSHQVKPSPLQGTVSLETTRRQNPPAALGLRQGGCLVPHGAFVLCVGFTKGPGPGDKPPAHTGLRLRLGVVLWGWQQGRQGQTRGGRVGPSADPRGRMCCVCVLVWIGGLRGFFPRILLRRPVRDVSHSSDEIRPISGIMRKVISPRRG